MSAQHTPMTVTAARVLNKRAAEACGIDADDQWMIHGDEFLDDAQAMLDASGAMNLLAALQSLIDMDVAYQRGPKVAEAVESARAAIAKATGGAA